MRDDIVVVASHDPTIGGSAHLPFQLNWHLKRAGYELALDSELVLVDLHFQ